LDDNGVLRNAQYVCRICVSQLPKKPKSSSQQPINIASLFDTESSFSAAQHNENNQPTAVSDSSRRPQLALVNGNFRGQIPHQLAILNRTELSMVSIINCVYTLSMLKPNSHVPGHYNTTGTVFSILNDLHSIASVLPRIPTLTEIAFMRSADSNSHVEFEYSPHKVLMALEWLAENNFNYDGKLERPNDNVWSGPGDTTPVPISFIPVTPDDLDGVPDVIPTASADGHASNPSAPVSGMSDVLLIPTEENRDLLTQLEKIIDSTNRCVLCVPFAGVCFILF
jgi:hypothetical protein